MKTLSTPSRLVEIRFPSTRNFHDLLMIACDGNYQQRVAYRAPFLRGAISEVF